MERVSGPFNGCYVATYACPVGDFGEMYIGHARVFAARPRSYWEEGSLLELAMTSACGSRQLAHRSACELAVDQLLPGRTLPDAGGGAQAAWYQATPWASNERAAVP